MSSKIEQLLNEGVQAFQEGNFLKADLVLGRVIRIDKHNFPALQILGLVKIFQSKPIEAIKFFRRAALINPEDGSLQYNLARVLTDCGFLEESLRHHKKAAKLAPQNCEVFLNYGNALFELGRLDEALVNYRKAIDIKPDFDLAILNFGKIQYRLKDYSGALTCFDKVIDLRPELPEALKDKGLTLYALHRYEEALNCFNKLIALRPNLPEVFTNQGLTLYALQRYEEALICFDKAIALLGDYMDAWINKGATLYELKRYEEALKCYEMAIDLKPDHPEVYLNIGMTLNKFRYYEEALKCYEMAIALKPDHPQVMTDKGLTLYELQRYEEALSCFDNAIVLKPNYIEAYLNKGMTLLKLQRYQEALSCNDKAIDLNPNFYKAWLNKGNVLNSLKQTSEAIEHYDKALAIKPDYSLIGYNKSLALLLLGDYENGLPLYEKRWESEEVVGFLGAPKFKEPLWLGKAPLNNKKILLYGEQGLGDFIQFSRYAKLVANLGAKVILETPEPLFELMKILEGVSELVIKGQKIPPFDYHCPLLSLPLAMNTRLDSIPAPAAYLLSNSDKVHRWKLKLGAKRKIRIGVAWSSTSGFKNDSLRSLKLSKFIEALPPDEFEYICLQKELKEQDRDFFQEYQNIRFFGDQLKDLSDTAALIENVDLVISTCTSIPHLSAALGKKTWILLSYVPDWRWLLDRTDSPWYPSVQLFRQQTLGDWSGVLEKVRRELSLI